MKTGRIVAGFLAGSLLGATAAVMTVPGYRNMVMKKAKTQGRRLMRQAKQFFPL